MANQSVSEAWVKEVQVFCSNLKQPRFHHNHPQSSFDKRGEEFNKTLHKIQVKTQFDFTRYRFVHLQINHLLHIFTLFWCSLIDCFSHA